MAGNNRHPYITRMSGAHQALTEKEKESLRLLLGGYDAKSMARHLGLSVHTINERLRDARRKLGTSSSREAARMLREIEGATPELLGDKAMGDAAPAANTHPAITDTRRGRGRAVWIAGVIVMSLVLALSALAALSGTASPPAQAPAAAAAENATVQAARAWLALVDKDDWNASWDATGQAFKALNTVGKWTEASRSVRGSFGTIRSRELITVDFAPAPPYGYWVIKFRADYTKKADAIETLSLAWEGGAWRVVGMTID